MQTRKCAEEFLRSERSAMEVGKLILTIFDLLSKSRVSQTLVLRYIAAASLGYI